MLYFDYITYLSSYRYLYVFLYHIEYIRVISTISTSLYPNIVCHFCNSLRSINMCITYTPHDLDIIKGFNPNSTSLMCNYQRATELDYSPWRTQTYVLVQQYVKTVAISRNATDMNLHHCSWIKFCGYDFLWYSLQHYEQKCKIVCV